MRASGSGGWWFGGAAALCLAVGVTLAPGPSRAEEPGGTRWDYRTLSWDPADTTVVLRRVSGRTDLDDPLQLAQSLAREGELRDNPELLAAIEARLEERLDEAGREGWEAWWLRERTVLVGGNPVPVPTVLLRRTAR